MNWNHSKHAVIESFFFRDVVRENCYSILLHSLKFLSSNLATVFTDYCNLDNSPKVYQICADKNAAIADFQHFGIKTSKGLHYNFYRQNPAKLQNEQVEIQKFGKVYISPYIHLCVSGTVAKPTGECMQKVSCLIMIVNFLSTPAFMQEIWAYNWAATYFKCSKYLKISALEIITGYII